MKENINQHFVPQYYLRNFTKNGSLFVFDSVTKNIFTNSPINIAFKKYCYDVNPKLLSTFLLDEVLVDTKYVDDIIRKYNEDVLAAFVGSFNIPAQRLRNSDLRKTFSIVDLHSLYDFALVQLFRNPRYNVLGKTVIDSLISNEKFSASKVERLENTINGIELLVLMSTVFYNVDINFKESFNEIIEPIRKNFQTIKEDLENSTIIMYLNASEKVFICSDSPIGIKMNFDSDNTTFEVLSIPINPRIAFLCINSRVLKNTSHLVSGSKLITNENVDELINLNLLTTYSSQRFLYSENDDFINEVAFISGQINLKLFI